MNSFRIFINTILFILLIPICLAVHMEYDMYFTALQPDFYREIFRNPRFISWFEGRLNGMILTEAGTGNEKGNELLQDGSVLNEEIMLRWLEKDLGPWLVRLREYLFNQKGSFPFRIPLSVLSGEYSKAVGAPAGAPELPEFYDPAVGLSDNDRKLIEENIDKYRGYLMWPLIILACGLVIVFINSKMPAGLQYAGVLFMLTGALLGLIFLAAGDSVDRAAGGEYNESYFLISELGENGIVSIQAFLLAFRNNALVIGTIGLAAVIGGSFLKKRTGVRDRDVVDFTQD